MKVTIRGGPAALLKNINSCEHIKSCCGRWMGDNRAGIILRIFQKSAFLSCVLLIITFKLKEHNSSQLAKWMLRLLETESASAQWYKNLHYTQWTSPLLLKPDIFNIYDLKMKLHLVCSSRWIKKNPTTQQADVNWKELLSPNSQKFTAWDNYDRPQQEFFSVLQGSITPCVSHNTKKSAFIFAPLTRKVFPQNRKWHRKLITQEVFEGSRGFMLC